MRVALAQFIYESNTFNPAEAELASFTRHGAWLTEPVATRTWASNSRSQLQGSLDALAARGLRFDGPGSTSLNFARLPFTGARRELYPHTQSPQHPLILWQSI